MRRDWCSALPNGLRLSVQIMPNAKKTEIIGILEDALKIRLHAPALEGKANEALIRFLADVLHLPKSAISITHGHTNKRKLIEIASAKMSVDAVKAILKLV
jgi:uncharacterized protein (TIGR00251 family)